VAFTILLVTANTMSMAVRERRKEIAVLKTLGFPSGLVMALILGEAVLIGALGGTLGLLLSRGLISTMPSMPMIGDLVRGFPNFGLSIRVGTLGLGFALLLSVMAGIIPAYIAFRARITDMLRTV
jgi:putative ABC transport system permease protein